jgi:hypothetical protein
MSVHGDFSAADTTATESTDEKSSAANASSRTKSKLFKAKASPQQSVAIAPPNPLTRRKLSLSEIESFLESGGEFIWSDATPVIVRVRRAYDQLQTWRALTQRLMSLSASLPVSRSSQHAQNNKLTLADAKRMALEVQYCAVDLVSDGATRLHAAIAAAEELQQQTQSALSRTRPIEDVNSASAIMVRDMSLDEILKPESNSYCLTLDHYLALAERVKACSLIIPSLSRLQTMIRVSNVGLPRVAVLCVFMSHRLFAVLVLH